MKSDWTKIACISLDSRPRLELPKRLSLPVLPQSILAFTEIAENPDAGPQQLAAPLEIDAALTSELLRQINSISNGLKQKVVSVSQAISLLGPRRTKTLVLTSALQTATKGLKSRLIHAQQFQRENRVRAMFACETARALGFDTEVAYIAGLLQDFLLPLLTEAFYSDYSEILGQETDLIEQERKRFGWDHASVAAATARDWGFPDELVAGILFHHDADRAILDSSLRETSVIASIAAGCLPDSLNQSLGGFDTLLVLQDVLPDFRSLEVACTIDEVLAEQGQEINLSEQLGQLALANLEQRRFDRIHHYRKLGNYLLEDKIGDGGMGIVYRAKHCMLKRPAAIKLLHADKVSPDALARFESEVQLTCGLTSPHTVAVYDYGVTAEGLCYYAMEYLDGITLAQLVEQYGPQSPGRVIHFMKQVCLSLAEAHGTGLIHRDLKPENLMLCRRGGVPDTLKVLDFGLACATSSTVKRDQASGTFCGTPRYMPPEVILDGHAPDPRSDLYSLGAVGYFLLTGEPVFSDSDIAKIFSSQVNVTPKRPSLRLGERIDEDIEEIIMQCLAKSRQYRPASAQQLYYRLNECQSANSWDTHDAIDWWEQRETQSAYQPAIANDDRNLGKTCLT